MAAARLWELDTEGGAMPGWFSGGNTSLFSLQSLQSLRNGQPRRHPEMGMSVSQIKRQQSKTFQQPTCENLIPNLTPSCWVTPLPSPSKVQGSFSGLEAARHS